ncbi:hypothetical protein [Marivita sp. GX14005]|uniref:hypothetical protein n=1 Tax=Marivita sp. GX14005 TaxID=2942276 RepID=UPI002019E5A2|nr:hypothetical protein [Marivita sp. GX14005]MCL3881036.1 hypothetical protein [Marivita sp. GX14005]
MDRNFHSVKSRPKVIILHLGSVESGAERMCGVLDGISEAAIATGLPIIVIASSVGSMPAPLKDIEAPRNSVAQDSQQALNMMTKMAFCELSDVLWVTGVMENGATPEGVSRTPLEEAIPRLQSLSNSHRRASLRGNIPAEPEMAHTILLPLDLDLGSMEDPHRLLTHGRFIFDAVLLLEGQVPMAGFAVKTLEKLVADFAPIVTNLDNDFFDGGEELRTNLRRLSARGAKSVIAVSRHLDDGPDYRFVEEQVKAGGLLWYHTAWDGLVKINIGTPGALRHE